MKKYVFLLVFTSFFYSLIPVTTVFDVDWANYVVHVDHKVQLGKNIAIQQRQMLRQQALDEVLIVSSRPLEAFSIDSSHQLRDFLSTNAWFSQEYSIFLQNLPLVRVLFVQGSLHAGIDIPLRGPKGLLSLLPLPWGQRHYESLRESEYIGEAYNSKYAQSEYKQSPAPVKYTGIIIDVRGMDFKPSLAPRVYSADGRLLYGPEFLSRTAGVQRGVAGYAKDANEKELQRRVGQNPLWLVPLEIAGQFRTDAVIHEDDASKLFDHPQTLKNVCKAKVVFIVN